MSGPKMLWRRRAKLVEIEVETGEKRGAARLSEVACPRSVQL